MRMFAPVGFQSGGHRILINPITGLTVMRRGGMRPQDMCNNKSCGMGIYSTGTGIFWDPEKCYVRKAYDKLHNLVSGGAFWDPETCKIRQAHDYIKKKLTGGEAMMVDGGGVGLGTKPKRVSRPKIVDNSVQMSAEGKGIKSALKHKAMGGPGPAMAAQIEAEQLGVGVGLGARKPTKVSKGNIGGKSK